MGVIHCLRAAQAWEPPSVYGCTRPRAGGARSAAGGQPSSSADQPAPSSSASSKSEYVAQPWKLFGRVINEDGVAARLLSSEDMQQGIVRSAAATASGLPQEDFNARLERLLTLLPCLLPRLPRFNPRLLAALVRDVDELAGRLVTLRALVPGVNLEAIAGLRPSLLLDPEWPGVPAAAARLQACYPDPADVARLVAAEPLLLAEDLDRVLAELERLAAGGAGVRARDALLADPGLASQAARLSHLSLWLGDPREEVARILLADPSLIYSVQQGVRGLGPGAEFLE